MTFVTSHGKMYTNDFPGNGFLTQLPHRLLTSGRFSKRVACDIYHMVVYLAQTSGQFFYTAYQVGHRIEPSRKNSLKLNLTGVTRLPHGIPVIHGKSLVYIVRFHVRGHIYFFLESKRKLRLQCSNPIIVLIFSGLTNEYHCSCLICRVHTCKLNFFYLH